jgi:polyphosphate kinase
MGDWDRHQDQWRWARLVLAERDLLVHHPYDSFEATVQRFLIEAADDPAVRSIRLTLYRTGGDSPIADALLRAAGGGRKSRSSSR